MRQLDLFAAAKPGASTAQTPDPNVIRERLNAVLEQLRAANSMPWKPAELRSWRHVFHNMANWLPPEERDKLRRDFTAEIARLERI
jgi:hypothetical protein